MHPDAYQEMAALEASHWWYQGRRRILEAMLARLDLPADAAILEIGCGTGGNLAMLSRHGRVTAVEMDDGARAISRRRHPDTIAIHAGWLPDDLPDLGRTFDLICLFDVLEHVAEDTPALRRLRGLLSPGGRIMLTVPAYPWLWSRHDEHHHHQRRYTARTLTGVITAAQLEVERLSYFNALLFPLAALVRLFEKLSGRPSRAAADMPSARINAGLARLFGSESWLLRHINLAFGLSLLAIIGHPAATPHTTEASTHVSRHGNG